VLDFIFRFSRMILLQVEAVQKTMSEALTGLVESVIELDNATKAHRDLAEGEYENAFFKPDDDAKSLMDAAQGTVDAIFDSATEDALAVAEATGSIASLAGSRFSKAVEALSGLHTGIGQPLMAFMGVCSVENVVSQSMEHISQAIRFFIEELEQIGSEGDLHQALSGCAARTKEFLKGMLSSVQESKAFKVAFAESSQGSQHAQPLGDNANLQQFVFFILGLLRFTSEQLESVKASVLSAFEAAMGQVSQIAVIGEEQKRHADTMLVRKSDSDPDQFVQASIKESLGSHASDKMLHNKTQKALEELSDNLDVRLFKIVSELSIEDVIGQRLEHVIFACVAIADLIAQEGAEALASPVQPDLRERIVSKLRQIFSEFTMESEKKCFIRAFGDEWR
jgi:hypothetical protein